MQKEQEGLYLLKEMEPWTQKMNVVANARAKKR